MVVCFGGCSLVVVVVAGGCVAGGGVAELCWWGLWLVVVGLLWWLWLVVAWLEVVCATCAGCGCGSGSWSRRALGTGVSAVWAGCAGIAEVQ